MTKPYAPLPIPIGIIGPPSPAASEPLSFLDALRAITSGSARGAWIRPVGWRGRAIGIVERKLVHVPATADGYAGEYTMADTAELLAPWEICSSSVVPAETP